MIMDRTREPSDDPFEYRELLIPLNLRLEGSRYPTRRQLAEFHGYEGVVVQHLKLAARDGWQADERADWDSLAAAGRFVTEADPAPDNPDEGATIYKAVTIRLRRLARRAGPDESGAAGPGP